MSDYVVDVIGVVVGIVIIVASDGALWELGVAIIAGSLGSAAGKLLAPKIKPTSLDSEGFKTLLRDPVVPRRILYGTRLIAGPIVFIETHGDENRVLHLVVALTTHPVEDITHVVINDDIIRISGSPANPGIEGNDLNADHFIANYTVTTLGETGDKWGRDAAPPASGNANIEEAPIHITKCNGWATAKNYVEHTGNSIYIPISTPTAVWFTDDVIQQKMISASINQKNLGTQQWLDVVATQDSTAYHEGGSISAPDERWTENSNKKHRLTNCSYIHLRIQFKSDEPWRTSLPRFQFLVKGKRIYDPTDDSTSDYYDSGRVDTNPMTRYWSLNPPDGTQRFDDPVSWKHTANGAACILDYLLDKHYGLGARTNGPGSGYAQNEEFDEIDWASFAQAITDSDDPISNGLSSPDTEVIPRFSINAVIESSQTPVNIIETMLATGLGKLIYSEGRYSLQVGKYKKPDTGTDIIDESYLAGDNLLVRTGLGRSELFNKAAGIYIQDFQQNSNFDGEPGLDGFPTFESHDFPMVSPLSGGVNPYEVEDGEEIIKDFDFPYTTNEFAAQYLAKLYLQRARDSLSVSGKFKPKILEYKVGDNVYIINSDLGWVASSQFSDPGDTNLSGANSLKQFLITSMTVNDDLSVDVTFIEEHSILYDWNDGDAIPLDVASNTALDLAKITALPPEPTWDTLTPDLPIDSTVKVAADGSSSTITVVQWRRGPGSAKFGIAFYEVEYGQVTDSGATNPASRVTDWIAIPRISPTSRAKQGPIELYNLDNISPTTDTAHSGTVRYEFRVRAISIYDMPSDWAYWIDSTYGDPLGHQIFRDIVKPPVPTGLTIDSKLGRGYLILTVDNAGNTARDNGFITLLVSKTQNDPAGIESQIYNIDVQRDFSVLTSEAKKIQINIDPPDNDPWYFWAGITDTSGNGPTIGIYDDWFPSGVTTWGNGVLGQLQPLLTYYIKPLRGTGIRGGGETLAVEGWSITQGGNQAPLSSGNVKLYTADSAGDMQTQPPPTGSEYLWDPIVAADIQDSLTIYLADITAPYSASNPLVHDTITLADITDGAAGSDALVGFYINNNKLAWIEEADGLSWRDATSEFPKFQFFRAGSEVGSQIFELDLDEVAGTVNVIKGATVTTGDGVFVIKINGAVRTFPYDAGETIHIEVTYTISGDSFTVGETWYAINEGIPGDDGPTGPIGPVGPAGNAQIVTAKLNYQLFATPLNGWIYAHGFDVDGNPADLAGYIFYDGGIINIEAGGFPAIKGREAAGEALNSNYNNNTAGWIIFETNLASTPFTHGGTQENICAARKTRNGWVYDTGTVWNGFTATNTMLVIGTYETSVSPNLVTSAFISPEAITLGSVDFEDSHIVFPNTILDDAINTRLAFLAGLRPPQLVAQLPVSLTDYNAGDMVVLLGDNRLYRLNEAEDGWVRVVPPTYTSLVDDIGFTEGHIGSQVTVDSTGVNDDDSEYKWYDANTSAIDKNAFIRTLGPSAKIGTKAIRNIYGTSYGGTANNDPRILSRDFIPYDSSKTYRARVVYRFREKFASTYRSFYAFVSFYDRDKIHIQGNVSPVADKWPNIGTFHYFKFHPLLGQSEGTTWQTAELQFGAKYNIADATNLTAEVPADAKYMRVGALMSYNEPDNLHDINELRIDEAVDSSILTVDSVVAGTIEAGAVSADALEANLILATEVYAGDINDHYVRLSPASNLVFYYGDQGLGFETFNGAIFAMNSIGTTRFAGELSAASGTFAGDITAASGNFSGTITGAEGAFAGTLSGNVITAANMKADSITSSSIVAGNILTEKINNEAVTITRREYSAPNQFHSVVDIYSNLTPTIQITLPTIPGSAVSVNIIIRGFTLMSSIGGGSQGNIRLSRKIGAGSYTILNEYNWSPPALSNKARWLEGFGYLHPTILVYEDIGRSEGEVLTYRFRGAAFSDAGVVYTRQSLLEIFISIK